MVRVGIESFPMIQQVSSSRQFVLKRFQTPGRRSALYVHAIQGRRRVLLAGAPCICGACCGRKGGWYEKLFAYNMAHFMAGYEEACQPVKEALFRQAFQRGAVKDVLEVGIGTGPNFRFYGEPKDQLHVTGIDPNAFMFPYAREAADTAGLNPRTLTLSQGMVEALPVSDASFDLVICTLVLCSVADVSAAVRELRRVLRPGGNLVYLEHVSASEQRPMMRLGQRLLNPLQQLVADGCHLDRDPEADFEKAGFADLGARRFDLEGLGPLSPHLAGVAVA